MTKLQKFLDRIDYLVAEAASLTSVKMPNSFEYREEEHIRHAEGRARATGWLASACNVIDSMISSPEHPHRRFAKKIAGDGGAWDFPEQVRSVMQVLSALSTDFEDGVIGSIETEATAIAFMNLVEHASFYLEHQRVDVAGVIAGVAFEDVMRQLRKRTEVANEEASVEALIVEFRRAGILTSLEEKHARAAAGLRDKATHAKWSEFNAYQVEACLVFTRLLIEKVSAT